MSHVTNRGKRVLRRRLLASLLYSTQVVDQIAETMYTDHYQWQKTLLGHTFSVSRPVCNEASDSGHAVVSVFKSWFQAHEEAQVMVASVLVVIGLWWLVRTVLTLLINLICPLLVVLLAVICVPQLRAPLLGQNYPVVVNLLRNILMKLAENIKTE